MFLGQRPVIALIIAVLVFGCSGSAGPSSGAPAGAGGQVSTGGSSTGGRSGGSSGLGGLDGGAAAGADAGKGGSAGASGSSGGAAGASGAGASGAGAAGAAGAGGVQQTFAVEPSQPQTLSVTIDEQTPDLLFTATLNGQAVDATWSVDRSDIATLASGPSSTATLTPTGLVGGQLTVSARWNGQTLERVVLIQLTREQNGYDAASTAEATQVASSPIELTQAGGVGSVGGEGLGPAVTDAATLGALANPSSDGAAVGLEFLYPYDQTVWPRGIAAPLLMWRSTLSDVDAIQIDLTTTTGSLVYTGTFGRPAVLAQTGGSFVRHPLPADIWTVATNTAAGSDRLVLSLTVAKGATAYGPISRTWTVAPSSLGGIIYYTAYGTALAKNSSGAVGGDGSFGGATLAMHFGDASPRLVAGATGTAAQCRACHSVASGGTRLVAQHGDDWTQSSAYDLTANGATESFLVRGMQYPGLFPDGTMALSPNAELLPLPDDATPLGATGLVSTVLGTPAYSADGTRVAFSPIAGSIANPQALEVMDFDRTALAFTNAVTIVDDSARAADNRPGWPSFFPDGKGVVFHHQTAAGSDGTAVTDLRTRKGAKAHIAMTSLDNSSSVTALDSLNGRDSAGNSYLPRLAQPITLSCTGDSIQVGTLDADHADDVDLNYQPSAGPFAAGGYSWIVFVSRRMYGSVANIPPFCSDPRGVDLFTHVTPKKLWVAAVDLNAPAGTDGSHPAFYLPAQELLAANGHPVWVRDTCKTDGAACGWGDECCNGFCEPNGATGTSVCSSAPSSGSCSRVREKCASAADCCDSTGLCINGFCTESAP